MKMLSIVLSFLTLFIPPVLSDESMDKGLVRHLLRRTGFSATKEEVDRHASRPYEEVVDEILAGLGTDPLTEIPSSNWWYEVFLEETVEKIFRAYSRGDIPVLTPEEHQLWQIEIREAQKDLKRWVFQQTSDSPSPLDERLALFWSNHFTSQMAVVRDPYPNGLKYLTLRRHGCKSFKDMVYIMAKDPTMIVYLDSQTNSKKSPNENFARELMELFTLGEGNGYSEQDIKEAAKCFTGWRVCWDSEEDLKASFCLDPDENDASIKTFMGKQIISGEEVIDTIFEEKGLQVAEYIVRKFWLEFISLTPDESRIQSFAESFHNSDFDIKHLLREILLSEEFRDSESWGALIKSPVEFYLSAHQVLGYEFDAETVLQSAVLQGQDLLDPPNVKGWPGGKSWYTTATVPERDSFVKNILTEDSIPQFLEEHRDTSTEELIKMFLSKDPVTVIPDNDGTNLIMILRAILVDPVNQTK